MQPPDLHDDAIVLRPFRTADAAIHLAGEDAETMRRLGEGEASTMATVEAWIDRCTRSWSEGGPVYTFGIRRRDDDVLVGHVDANTRPTEGVADGEAHLSYSLYPHARGSGYATRAVTLVCTFLGDLQIRGAVIRVEPDNDASIAVASRAGFARGETVTGSDGTTLVVFRRALGAGR